MIHFQASVFSHRHQRNGGGYDISFPVELEGLGIRTDRPVYADIGIRGGELIILVGSPLSTPLPLTARWLGRRRWYLTRAGHRKLYLSHQLCRRGQFKLRTGQQTMAYSEHHTRDGKPYWVIKSQITRTLTAK